MSAWKLVPFNDIEVGTTYLSRGIADLPNHSQKWLKVGDGTARFVYLDGKNGPELRINDPNIHYFVEVIEAENVMNQCVDE